MRTYQTLTLIGSILGIIIAFSVFFLLTVFDVGLTSLEENFGDTETYPQVERKSDLMQTGAQAGISILLMIIAIIVVFVLPKHPKPVGIYLIILSFLVLIGMGLYGILPFALFLPAGIVALRYKSESTRYRSFDRDDEERGDDRRVYSGGGGGSPVK